MPSAAPAEMHAAAEATDYLIVGAGTAGCVLANRLSASGRHKVLLIEAGRDFPPGREPASVRDVFPSSVSEPDYFWPDLSAEVGARPDDEGPRFSRPYQQARLMGGGSSIMGMIALRGLAADYDEWARLGAAGWDWAGVLPAFNRLERDLDMAGPLHGTDGPIPIRRHRAADWPPFCAALGEAMAMHGHRAIADANAGTGEGIFPTPMSNLPEGRVSAAMAYLTGIVRKRPNLRILCETNVDRILFEGKRAVGVEVRSARGLRPIRAQEVILAGGAIHSPALLLRSGVGPAAALRPLGIEMVADQAGVGAHLMNHPAVYLAAWLTRAARQPQAVRAWSQNSLRYSSGHAGCPGGDMFMFAFNKTGAHRLGGAIGSVNVSVYKSFSRGAVTLKSADPALMPQVRFNLLDDVRDEARLIEGVGVALSLLTAPAVARLWQDCFVAGGRLVQRVSRPRWPNRALSAALRLLLDALPPIRRHGLGPMAVDPARLLADPDALRAFVLAQAFPMGHVSGTCRMGHTDDPGAVTDPECRVRGLENLRVADASIMPSIPSANTHLPTLMVAEKAAELILAGR